ncbi:MAG: polysaccharide deacetylase [Rariglobus sp.]|nr:polysaccharide deacetylase [Rariglobus sp.]
MNSSDHTRCIVSLTYDDALPCHFESVAPLLEEHGLHGTFYVPCGVPFFRDIEAWREVASQGHELGNHTLFHPCHDQAWLDEAYNLRNYTARRWSDEVLLANNILSLVDGRTVRSFGNTCHHNTIGSGRTASTVEQLAPEFFIATRGEESLRPVDLKKINWFNLGTRKADHASFDQLSLEIGRMCLRGGWLILTCHGVGARDHKLHMDEDEHTRLVEWLATRQETIWTAPVRVVAEAIKPSRRALAQAASKT